MPGQHGNAVKEQRSREAIAVAEELRMDYLKGLLGSVQEVLFEENLGEYATGHAPNYCKVYVKTDENWHNEVKNVRITGLYQDGLTGEAE